MKKINSLVLSTLTAALLVGCGGGSGASSSSSGTTTPTVTTTDVTVERGPLWGASVTDAKGTPATQKAGDSNIYIFNSAPTYPIKAVGGIIDIDGDSSTTDDIFDFTGKELISYTNVITPITNYLGDITSEAGKAKLAKLESLGLIKDDLVNTVASKSATKKAEMISLTNALFELMNDSDTNNDDLTNETNYNSFKNRFDTFVNMVKDDVAINAKASSQALEETVLKGVLNNYTEAEGKSRIEKIKASLFTLTSEMISGKSMTITDGEGTMTALFNTNNSYSESWDDTKSGGDKGTCSGTWAVSGNKVSITSGSCGNTDITFTETPKAGYTISFVSTDESGTANITSFVDISSNSTPTTPTTTSFVSGKSITGLFGDDVTFIANFNTDHSYSDTTLNDGDCSGTWNDIGNNTIVTSCGTFSFPSANLSVGVNFTIDGDQSAPEGATITSVSSINSGSTTTPTETTFTLTNEMFSGKKLNVEESGDIENISLKSDGTIYYTWSFTDGDSGSCDGTWNVSGNKLNATTTNCTDNDNSTNSIIFTSEPTNGVTVTFVSGDGSTEIGTITTVSNLK